MKPVKQQDQMENQKITIKNEAARMGYFGQPVENLIDYMRHNRVNHYKEKVSEARKTIEVSETKLEDITKEYDNLTGTVGNGKFIPGSIFLFISSIVMLSFFLIFDIGLSIISLPMMFTACFSGSLLHHLKMSNSNLHKTIIFATLGFLSMVVMIVSLLKSSHSFFTAFPIGLFSGLCIYLMNISFQTISENFMIQIKYILSVYRKWKCNKKVRATTFEVNNLNSELQALLTNIELEIDEYTYIIQYEYELGVLARKVQTNQEYLINIDHIKKEDFRYAA